VGQNEIFSNLVHTTNNTFHENLFLKGT